jgi:superfamily II DNA/RNA helicase
VARRATTAESIEQALIEFRPSRKDRSFAEKRALLRTLIEAEGEGCRNAIIFCNRKIDVDVVAKSLKKHGFDAAPIHGDLDQSVRTRTLDGFRDGTLRFLVASDVAARGLDIPAVSHIFNFDVPSHAEDYVHRIGRTGRAGRTGKALTLATPADEKYIAAIESLLQRPLVRGEAPEVAADDRPARDRKPKRADKAERAPKAERTEKAPRPQREAEPEAAPEPAESPAAQAAEAAAPASLPEGDRRGGDRDKRGGRRDRRRGRDEDAPVVGMGDHVPEFLTREFRTG